MKELFNILQPQTVLNYDLSTYEMREDERVLFYYREGYREYHNGELKAYQYLRQNIMRYYPRLGLFKNYKGTLTSRTIPVELFGTPRWLLVEKGHLIFFIYATDIYCNVYRAGEYHAHGEISADDSQYWYVNHNRYQWKGQDSILVDMPEEQRFQYSTVTDAVMIIEDIQTCLYDLHTRMIRK